MDCIYVPNIKLNSSYFKLFNGTKCDGFDTGENICICFSMKISADFSKKSYRNFKANINVERYQQSAKSAVSMPIY